MAILDPKDCILKVNGEEVHGFVPDSRIRVCPNGGEASVAMDADRPARNQVTEQGLSLLFDLIELSPSAAFLRELRRQQKQGKDDDCCSLTARGSVQIPITISNAGFLVRNIDEVLGGYSVELLTTKDHQPLTTRII
jgi:hypothetical protein